MTSNADAYEHHRLVNEFLQQKRREDPERFAEVAAKYPTLTAHAWRTIRRRERPVGLLGAQPAHISPEVAERCGYESVYAEEEA